MSKYTGSPFPDDEAVRREVEKAEEMAKEYASEDENTEHLMAEAVTKAEKHRGALKKCWDDLVTLFRLIGAYRTKKYREVPLKTILMAIGAVIYLVNPFDIVPDFIPGFGYVDDVTVIAAVMKTIRGDVDEFRAWEDEQSS